MTRPVGTTPSSFPGPAALGAHGMVAGAGSLDRGPGRWYDDEAGPIVRPYTMTRGRTRPAGDVFIDLIAIVSAVPGDDAGLTDQRLQSPEYRDILGLCREPLTLADLGSATGLPLGVIRVLLGDLGTNGLISITRPVPPAQLPDESILREVLDGLRVL
ncbi:DUF742 domain-containing protein [Streptomyces actinomycinicus]|uniref:DUF742 domain-containing protein n=1 Tax=Streptomyces actinomycinicus TaxID=1695166 RepID=A0A937EIZ1_9ACTN|nr:DUF742 domain-containing protein [Streptomyces actinomycinicus]MBL1083691.1 DUF742 domain-containing protein [Streptomyces actinomycinicus]